MRSTKATRWLSGTLAALMLAQGMCLPAGAAGWWGSWFGGSSGQTSQVTTLSETKAADVQLQDGTAIIPAGADEATVKQALFDALVVNKDGIDPQSLEWEYYCGGREKTLVGTPGLRTHDAWGSINGFESYTGSGWTKVTYTHPALAENDNSSYLIHLVDANNTVISNDVTVTKAAKQASSIALKEDVSVALPYNDNAQVDYNTLRQNIFNAVVASTNPELTLNDVTIEYYTKAVTDADAKYVALEGETITVLGVPLTYPAISKGEQKIRISYAGNDSYSSTSAETMVTFTERGEAPYTLKETPDTVVLAVDEDMNVDYEAVRESIFNAVVASSDVLTADNVTITYYYEGLTDLSSKWIPLEGESVVGSMGYPAISSGTQKVRIYWPGNQQYAPTTIDANITVAERSAAPYTLKETPDDVTLAVDANLAVDYDALKDAIFNAVVASSDILTAENVTITYESTAKVDIGNILPKDWVALAGETKTYMNIPVAFPAISAGSQKIRIYWPGNQTYAPTTIEATVEVKDREQVQFNLNEGPYEVGMKFTDDQAYDYSVTAQAIYNAVVASTTPEVDFSQVTLEFSKNGINFEPLNQTNFWTSFGVGEWKIKISVADTQTYRGNSVIVDVTTTDNRIASAVVLKSGVSFTYNMEPAVMKQAIFDNVIDWENSNLPAKETLTVDDFVIEYKAKLTDAESGVDLGLEDLKDLFGKIPGMDDFLNNDILTQWVPLEGKEYSIGNTTLGKYPQIGAGENQSIRISYNGNADYRPSESTQGTVTVNKAKVSVKVNSTNIYADEALPAGFITTDPGDDFDIYTIYAGITSNVTTGIYLDLPDRYTNSTVLKLLDPIVEKLYGKSFTQMMNDGVTVGELRDFFSTEGLLDTLAKLNIDTGTFGQILTVINKMPGIMDSVRVAFGTPSRAGLYTVAAVTDNKNYETGVGIGFLLVKMHLSGSNLTWNQEISGGKLTAEEAQNFDFGATLSYNGDVTVSQDSVHYLYSGFTSKWRIYSSTTTPPTEPGRYVVTVCILGGNYMAAPITRSFQITK